MWDIIKRSNIHVIVIPGEERGNGTEKFQRNNGQNFSKFSKMVQNSETQKDKKGSRQLEEQKTPENKH